MLQKFKSFVSKNEFVKNVLTLMTGTTIAQAIPIVIAPIITRIYSPEDIGALALFMAIAILFSTIANGRYELAVLLPEKEEDAINIVALGFIITFSLSLLLLIIILLFHDSIISLLKNNNDISFWIYFIPITVFVMGSYNMLNYYNNRMKNYKDIAKSVIVKAIAMSVIQLIIGLLKKGSFGLFSGQILSNLFANATLLKNTIKDKVLLSNINRKRIISLAIRYKKFPKYSLWSSFLNTASIQTPIYLLNSFFATNILGFFSIAHRFISMPISLISSSIGQVYFQKSTELKKDKELLKNLTLNTYEKLLQLGVIPFSILCFFGDYLFSFYFSEEYLIAGEYAQVLSIWVLFAFIVSPISTIFSILEKQNQELIFNTISFTTRVIVLIIGGLILKDAYYTILMFGITGAILYMLLGVYLLKIIGVKIYNSIFLTFKYIIPSMAFFGLIRYLISLY